MVKNIVNICPLSEFSPAVAFDKHFNFALSRSAIARLFAGPNTNTHY